MKNSLVLIFLVFINVGCSQSKSKLITEVSQDELNQVFVLDVRTPNEFAAGHLPNAINIDWLDRANFIEQVKKTVSKDKTVYVYCKVGGRSAKASDKLNSLGYTVVNLEGGYDAYKAADQK